MKVLTSATERLFKPIEFDKSNRINISVDKEARKFIFDFYSIDSSGHRAFSVGNSAYKFIKRLPEVTRLRDERYLVGMTDTSAMLVNQLWPKNQIVFDSEEAETYFTYLLCTLKLQETNLEHIAAYKLDKTQTAWNGYIDNKEWPLTPYQKVATVCSLTSEAFALHMQAGTGKTPVAIAVMCNDALRIKRCYRALIVVPKSVRSNWADEIERFKTCDGKVTILRGTEFDRIRLLLDAMRIKNGERFTAVIVTYETMTRMLDQFAHIEWDLGILDEQHAIASPITKRSKAALVLRDMCKRRLGLTGTPVRNHALDLYAQLEFLGQGFSGFSSWQAFKQFYGVFEKTQYGEKLIGIQNLPLIQERLARLSFSITKEEALPDLPNKTYDICEVEMSQQQIKAYNELTNTLKIKIENILTDSTLNREMVVQNILVQLLRLAQITSGFMIFGESCDEEGNIVEEKSIQYFNPNPKLDMLVKLLKGDEEEEIPAKTANDKTIIWATWIIDIETIKQRLIRENIRCVTYHGRMTDTAREDAVKDFNNDPLTTVFIGNAAAGGVGLNLLGYPPNNPNNYQTNANHVIYFSQNWSQIQRSQSEDRAHRRGTREPVRVTDLVVPNSIDEEIRARVVKKKKMAFEVSDIRAIIHAINTNQFGD